MSLILTVRRWLDGTANCLPGTRKSKRQRTFDSIGRAGAEQTNAHESVDCRRIFPMADLIRTLSILNEAHATLSREQAGAMMQMILEDTQNQLPNMQIEAVLMALAARPVTAEELAGFVDAMRAAAVTLPFPDEERATLVIPAARAAMPAEPSTFRPRWRLWRRPQERRLPSTVIAA